MNSVQFGLLLDIFGVLLLGRALFLSNVDVVRLQGGTYWDYNPHLIRALCEQRVDAMFGLPFLASGFVLQLISTMSLDINSLFQGLLWLFAIFGFGSYFLMRNLFVDKMFEYVTKKEEQDEHG